MRNNLKRYRGQEAESFRITMQLMNLVNLICSEDRIHPWDFPKVGPFRLLKQTLIEKI